ncbi:N-acetyltransferase [Romeria aff. gracilis LEGE 07310]|uniref:N-acetyltransferase n=1 Tax=Vasconcelosia minhoensis LEGE 07310 TaxID=915328 RepID=A0A8J7DKS0_9CYAN|nr:GNAT family N-acetyltransferase [Romeria gracilis]MBE9076701.1 N-acetyltransferase [Romeria aff. gracilis LEGE 07310]
MVQNLQSQYQYRTQWISRLSEVPQPAWDAMALPMATPFFEWEWLRNLETSGSAVVRAGWLPQHLTLWRNHELIAAAPLYLKGHSRGEFVFDYQWAELAERLGISYYPKLLGMSPFTPAEGYRFLIAPGEDEAALSQMMVYEIDAFCQQNGISGCHFLYVDPAWQSQMEGLGFRPWMHHNYVWQNQDYGDFNDYLARFNANQRRNIKRERKSVQKAGLRFQVHTGEILTADLCSRVYDFYSDTCDKFGWWGSKYLTPKFFQQLYPQYRDRVVIFAAYTEASSSPVGLSFCLTKRDRLYGRYWGAFEDYNHLHFNACYYEPIDWAIQQGIQVFDPGAGGRHKQRRGFPATPNHSLHRFYEPTLSQVLEQHIERINAAERAEIALINQGLPVKGDSCATEPEPGGEKG